MVKKNSAIPTHVGLIMDGNGRWAKKRLLPRSAGHGNGMNRMIALAEHACDVGVKYFTVYALSTENLSRPEEELEKLYSLIIKYFKENVQKLIKKGACVKVIGNISLLPTEVQSAIREGLALSPESAPFTFILALAYGSRPEIINAVNLAIERGEKVTEEDFNSLLYTSEIPDPDLIIRTGGELRLSNFLTYQAAYAELYFSEVLFPDFSDAEFDKAIEEYGSRVRRFGKI